MKLFSFIKRKLKKDPTAEQRIRRVIEYMPEFYKTHRQFLACIEYLDYNEWGLALDSLIQLADETGHYFSEEFWLELAAAADTMKLTKEAGYCKEQIKRNE
jgi:hypothetical protein